MSTMSEQTRAKAKEKVARLTKAGGGSVDASGWKPYTGEMGDVQTGMRPLSRRQYRSGGKVAGLAAAPRADRPARAKGGGIVDDYFNVDQKKANQLRDGDKHTGGLKSGGRAKKASGGPGDDDEGLAPVSRATTKPVTNSVPSYSRTAVQKMINQGNRRGPKIGGREARMIHALLKGRQKSDEPDGYATGGRTGKMMGGPMAGVRPMQRPVMPTARTGAAPMGIRPQVGVRPMMRKAGGKVHDDEAEDKKLIKSEMHKAGCSCAKCSGGKVEKKAGGSIDKLEGLRDKGGREARAAGGRTKKGAMNVNIIIAQKPDGMPPRPPMMPPGMPPGAGPVGMHQGAPPPQAAAPAPMQPPQAGMPMMRKSGGRTTYPIKTGGGGGEARLAKIRAYG